MNSKVCKDYHCPDYDFKVAMDGKWKPYCLFWDCFLSNVENCNRYE